MRYLVILLSLATVTLFVSCDDETSARLIDELLLGGSQDSLPPSEIHTNNFAERFPLPDSLRASEMESKVAYYARTESTDSIRQTVDSLVSQRLLAYSFQASLEGVRFNSAEMLRDGLLALSIDNAKFGFYDHLTAMALLWHSHEILELDPEPVFREVAGKSSERYALMINDFLARSEAQKDIRTFGYIYLTQPQFEYVYRPIMIDPTNQAPDTFAGEILAE